MKTFEGDFTYLGEVLDVEIMPPDINKLSKGARAFVKMVKSGQVTIEELLNDPARNWYIGGTPHYVKTGVGQSREDYMANKHKITKLFYEISGISPYSVNGWYFGSGTRRWHISSSTNKPQTLVSLYIQGKKDAITFLNKEKDYEIYKINENKDLINSLILSNELSLAESKLHLITSEKIKNQLVSAIESAKERNRLVEETKKVEQKKKQRNILLAVLATAGGAYLTMKE